MQGLRDCIVSFIDLNNVKNILNRKSKKGVRIMHGLHQLVSQRAHSLKAHDEICFWQDSVLLLALVEEDTGSFSRVMNDAKNLKEAIHALHPCHAICVKGQAFPAPQIRSSNTKPRSIYLSASSLAFSNCFTIEEKLKHHRADWYVDSRITNKVQTRTPDCSESVKLLPRLASRKIHMFHGSFV